MPDTSPSKVDENRYRLIDAEFVIETIETLSRRIEERFHDSGLSALSRRLLTVARYTREHIELILKPNYWIRIPILLLIIIIILGAIGTLLSFHIPPEGFNLFNFIQVLEAGLNDLVLIGATVFFLTTIEIRLKRQRTLKELHELRSIVHIIDMMQLRKDPDRTIDAGKRTASSPVEEWDAYSLGRYLDYCSELLSLSGKLAALYAQHFNDAVVLAAVNEVESLSGGISQKIWQKLMILHTISASNYCKA